MRYFSLGIPAHNEEESIARMIGRVLKSRAWIRHKKRREIIVCANACTDKTVDIVRGLQRENPEIKLIETPVKGKNNAWGIIVRNSNPHARNIFFSDADVLVDPRSYSELDRALNTHPEIDIASGISIPTAAFIKKRGQYDEDVVQMWRAVAKKGTRGVCTALYGIRRSVALKTQLPTHPQIVDDGFLNFHFRGRIMVVPHARVVFRFPSREDLRLGRIRSTVSKRWLRRDPLFRAFEEDRNGKSRLVKILALSAKLGPLRAMRIFLTHVHKPKSIGTAAQGHIDRGSDAWVPLASTKLTSRRGRPSSK